MEDYGKPAPGEQYDPKLYRLTRINPGTRQAAKPSGFRKYGFAPFARSDAQVKQTAATRLAAANRKSQFMAEMRGIGQTAAEAKAAWKGNAPTRKANRVYNRVPSGRWNRDTKGRYVKDELGRRIRSKVPMENINLRTTAYDIGALTGKRMGKDIARYLSFLGPSSVQQFLSFDEAYYNTATRITPDEVADFVSYSVAPWERSHEDLSGHWNDFRFESGNPDQLRGKLNKVQPYQTRIKKDERYVKQQI